MPAESSSFCETEPWWNEEKMDVVGEREGGAMKDHPGSVGSTGGEDDE